MAGWNGTPSAERSATTIPKKHRGMMTSLYTDIRYCTCAALWKNAYEL